MSELPLYELSLLKFEVATRFMGSDVIKSCVNSCGKYCINFYRCLFSSNFFAQKLSACFKWNRHCRLLPDIRVRSFDKQEQAFALRLSKARSRACTSE
jgi:hypothetical protein